MTSITSLSTSGYTTSLSSLDTNGDGVVSADELAAAGTSRTQDPSVSSENAASGLSSQVSGLFMTNMLDALESADFTQMPPPGGEKPSAEEMFSTMDTDGDGSVTEAEFLAARPEDMSEDMAKEQFAKLDTESTGTLTKDQFVTAMESLAPPAPGDFALSDDGETESVADVLDQMSAIIAQYMTYSSASETEDEITA